MKKLLFGIILLFITNSAIAEKLYCNAGVTINHSKYSASLQQSNGTSADFEYSSTIKTRKERKIIIFRGTDIPGMLGIPKNTNTNTNIKVILQLDGQTIPFSCHK